MALAGAKTRVEEMVAIILVEAAMPRGEGRGGASGGTLRQQEVGTDAWQGGQQDTYPSS